MANARAASLKGQFIMDMHTHFLRDDTRLEGFVRSREAVGKAGWNPALVGKSADAGRPEVRKLLQGNLPGQRHQGRADLGSGSEEPRDWFLTNEMKADARAEVNRKAGTRRMFSHAIFMPGMPGWLDKVDRDLELLQARLVQGLHRGRQHQQAPGAASLASGRREAALPVLREAGQGEQDAPQSGQCVRAQGPVPAAVTQRFPHLVKYADVRDVAKAAKDWPQLNFIIYHSGYPIRLGTRERVAGSSSKRPAASTG
jgi:hypothetical protein